jgi:hypothetical protein
MIDFSSKNFFWRRNKSQIVNYYYSMQEETRENFMKPFNFRIMISKAVLLPVLLNLLFGAVAFAEDYLCIADMATGFRYNEGSKNWEESSFRLKNSKYLISGLEKGAAYNVKHLGGSDVMSRCKDDFNDIGSLFCKGTFDIKFNKINGRFVLTYTFGYFNVLPGIQSDSVSIRKSDQGSETPFLEIGKCTLV